MMKSFNLKSLTNDNNNLVVISVLSMLDKIIIYYNMLNKTYIPY